MHVCRRSVPWALLVVATCWTAKSQVADPLAEVFATEAVSGVESLIADFRERQQYKVSGFPLPPQEFEQFKEQLVAELVRALGIQDWVVGSSGERRSSIRHLFRDRVVRPLEQNGVEMEAHVVELIETGDRIPLVLCLPPGDGRRPAVAAFPGHGEHPLHDLVFGEDSYQRAIAARLARAGFASVAVEKVDSGYMSRHGASGVDEREMAGFRLAMGFPIRSVQLMANLAAVEILADHPRVDEARIGATGVSLGGWLAVQRPSTSPMRSVRTNSPGSETSAM